MPNTEKVALSALTRELASLTGASAPSYRRLYALTLDGALPAEQVNGRWFVQRADLAQIAARLGLSRPAAAPASRRKTRTAVAEQAAA